MDVKYIFISWDGGTEFKLTQTGKAQRSGRLVEWALAKMGELLAHEIESPRLTESRCRRIERSPNSHDDQGNVNRPRQRVLELAINILA